MTVGTTLSAGIACDTFASVVKNPKKNVAPKIPSGFHCPKMSAAIDKKPRPATLPLNSPLYVTSITPPPSPESAPLASTPNQRILCTLTPALSTADGCSPQARRRKPKDVLYKSQNENPHTASTSHVDQYEREKNSAPSTGIFERNGMSSRTMPMTIGILPLPVTRRATYTVRAAASILIAVPEIV